MFPDTWPKFKTGSKQKQTKSKFRGLEMCAVQLLLSPLVVSTLFLSLGKQETTKGTIWLSHGFFTFQWKKTSSIPISKVYDVMKE